MKVIKTSANFDPKDYLEVYIFTDRNKTHNMKELEGQKCICGKWLLAEDADIETGEVIEKLYMEVDGEVYATISKSFIRSFKELFCAEGYDITDRTLDEFAVIEKATKAGRKCILFSPISFREI